MVMLETESEILKNIMLSEEIVDEEQVLELEEENNRSGRSFSKLLVDYEFLDNEQLNEIIAGHLGSEVVNLPDFEVDKEIVDLLSGEQARSYNAIPIGYDQEGNLRVATSNPLDYKMADELSFILDKSIKICVATEDQIETALEKYYPAPTMNDMVSEMELSIDEDSNPDDLDVNDIENMANNKPIIRFVDIVLQQAIKDEASDIHFEPFEDAFKIRYRIDGVLYEMSPPPKNLAFPVTSRLKVMSGLDIAERRVPQDGRIQVRIAGKYVDLRISCIPTEYGESVVLRILDRSVVHLDLDVLGMNEGVLKGLREIIQRPNGVIIVTGPTGCGKTTTLYSALKEVNKIDIKILTAEDPVEYNLEGVIQLPINPAIDMTFARALRAFLRQDPDVIMIGEIRDLDTAHMAVQASLTGHMVFTTLHTKEAADAITRLIDMGVEPFLLNSALVGVLAQRLVRKICESCIEEYDPTEEEIELLGLDAYEIKDKKFHYGKGCPMCNQTGYKGRKAITELLRMSPQLSDLISQESATNTLRRKAVEQGMTVIRDDGINAVLNGETTVEEILKYT